MHHIRMKIVSFLVSPGCAAVHHSKAADKSQRHCQTKRLLYSMSYHNLCLPEALCFCFFHMPLQRHIQIENLNKNL